MRPGPGPDGHRGHPDQRPGRDRHLRGLRAAAVGAATAITNAGIAPEDIILVGFDAVPDEVALIVAGTEDASVAQFPAKIGELGIDTLSKVVSGETVEPLVDTGTAIVTAGQRCRVRRLAEPTARP